MGGKIHELKCWPEFFNDLRSGRKTFELRKDDRGFEVGDILVIYEYDPVTKHPTLNILSVEVTYILRDFVGLSEGYCIMSVKEMK